MSKRTGAAAPALSEPIVEPVAEAPVAPAAVAPSGVDDPSPPATPAPPTPPEAASVPRYVATRAIEHDGTRFADGDEIAGLSQAAAAELLRVHAIALVNAG